MKIELIKTISTNGIICYSIYLNEKFVVDSEVKGGKFDTPEEVYAEAIKMYNFIKENYKHPKQKIVVLSEIF